MKKLIRNISLLLFAISIVSCDDFLDRPPLGEIQEVNFFQTQEDAVLATNGVYNSLRRWFITGGFPILDILSDEASKGSNPTDASFLNEYEQFTFAPSQGLVNQMWSNLYIGVRRANSVIQNVPDIDMNPDLRNRLVAEARFLRAYFYFELVRAYGDLPKVTSTQPDPSLTRSPAQEIYDEIIIPDLMFARENLPEKSQYASGDLGRATRGAATGMLAKVYLFLDDFAQAESFALEVINSGEYSLDPDFSNVFAENNVQGIEAIFEVSSISDNFNDGGNQYANTFGVRGPNGKGWGFVRPTFDFINSFEEGDPRLDQTVIFLDDVIDGEEIIGDDGTPDTTMVDGEIVEIETYVEKMWVAGDIPNVSFGSNRHILRYADVLLIAAEASNQNGNTTQALMFLNMVRERARGGNPDLLPDITETDQATLRRLIIDERSYELSFEGHRYLDLVRTGLASEILGPLGFQVGKHELLPIPQAEIDITEGRLTQNPGYD